MRFTSKIGQGKSQVDEHEVQRWMDLEKTVNYGMEFGAPGNLGNIKGQWIQVKTPAKADTDFTVEHNLGTVPNGIHIMQKDAACDVYNSPTTSHTTTDATLRATTGNANLTLFVH
jgi:hypothetical protein